MILVISMASTTYRRRLIGSRYQRNLDMSEYMYIRRRLRSKVSLDVRRDSMVRRPYVLERNNDREGYVLLDPQSFPIDGR